MVTTARAARERMQLAAVEAAANLARALLDRDDPLRAERAADVGLAIGPQAGLTGDGGGYRDDLWRLRLAALERGGRPCQSRTVRSAYQKVPAELGL